MHYDKTSTTIFFTHTHSIDNYTFAPKEILKNFSRSVIQNFENQLEKVMLYLSFLIGVLMFSFIIMAKKSILLFHPCTISISKLELSLSNASQWL